MSKILLLIASLSILQTTLFRFAHAICPCEVQANYLRCSLDESPDLNTRDCQLSPTINSIQITYNNSVDVNIVIPTDVPIIISPINPELSRLRIASLMTNATSIEISYTVHSSNMDQTIFPSSNTYLSSNLTLKVYVYQTFTNLMRFSIFSNLARIILNEYIVVFNTSVPGFKALDYSNILTGVAGLTSLTVSGSRHTFTENIRSLSCNYRGLLRLSLNNLILNEAVLNCFSNITYYTVQQCDYNGTAFLTSQFMYTSSLKMISNNPTDSSIKYTSAFRNFLGFPELTIIESKVDSSILRGIKRIRFNYLYLELKSYNKSDFEELISFQPSPFSVTIKSLSTLDVLPSGFFNKMDRINDIKLYGEFELKSDAICVFCAVNKLSQGPHTQIFLSSTRQNREDWNLCAETYISAINYYSRKDIRCPLMNSIKDCEKWAQDTEKCNFTAYENGICDVSYLRGGQFKYSESVLSTFFKDVLLNRTDDDTKEEKDSGTNRVIPVIAALCALLVAITVFVITIFFVRKQRRRQQNSHLITGPTDVYKEGPPPSYHDLSRVSIATSRTEKSIYPTLEPSIFPSTNPNDQIAPPLYTAPSENFPIAINQKKQSGPTNATSRASVTTSNTHFYESIDS